MMKIYTLPLPKELSPTKEDTRFPAMELLKSEDAGKTVSLIETVYRKTVLYPMLSISIYNYLIRRGMMKNENVFGALTSFESSINGSTLRGYQ